MHTRPATRPPRRRPLLLYGPLFLIPGAAVFALVLVQFQGLPPQREAALVFRIDPHFGSLAAPEDLSSFPAMLDPGGLVREIKSRYRVREAMRELDLFTRRTAEKQELLLDQTIQALTVEPERETGKNTFLVTVTLTRATHDPASLERLLENIRRVYLHHNVDRLIERQAREQEGLQAILARCEQESREAAEQFETFQGQDENRRFIPASNGDAPPIARELDAIRDELAGLAARRDDASLARAAELTERLRELNEFKKSAPAVMRQYNLLREQAGECQQRLADARSRHDACARILDTLRTHRDTRFAIVSPPGEPAVQIRAVESEQTSRFVIAAAGGVVAGLFTVLVGLLMGILRKGRE